MPNLSLWIGMGHVGHTPEKRELDGGKVVTKFTMAVNTGYKDVKKTSWLNIECWGKPAEYVAQYIGKGDAVFVEGRLEIEEYEGKDKATKMKVKVTADQIQKLGTAKQKENEPF